MRAASLFVALALNLALSGCSHMISPQGRAGITPGLQLDMIRNAPKQFLGKTLLVGGNILAVAPQEGYSTLEIYSWQLDRRGEPITHDRQGGRFIAVSEKLLDPQTFSPGRFVTLVGAVEGVEDRSIDGVELRLPLLRIEEICLLDQPLRYDGPPRLNADSPFPSPPWYETDNPYDPNRARPARDRMAPPY